MSDPTVNQARLEALIEMCGRFAKLQQEQGITPTSGTQLLAKNDGVGVEFAGEQFPADQVASSNQPVLRRTGSVSPVLARVLMLDRDLDLDTALLQSTWQSDKLTKEAAQAAKLMQQMSEVLERRIYSHMANRSLQRGERRANVSHDFEVQRKLRFEEDLMDHWRRVDWRQMEDNLSRHRR